MRRVGAAAGSIPVVGPESGAQPEQELDPLELVEPFLKRGVKFRIGNRRPRQRAGGTQIWNRALGVGTVRLLWLPLRHPHQLPHLLRLQPWEGGTL